MDYPEYKRNTVAIPVTPSAAPVQEPDYSICPTCGGMASDSIVPPAQRQSNAYDDYRETMRQAFEQQSAPVHGLEKGCHRSHPHENMDAMCELRTEIARLTNENARLKAAQRQSARSAWVGLTGHETVALWNQVDGESSGGADRFARAIEAKLRAVNGFSCEATEKNGGQA